MSQDRIGQLLSGWEHARGTEYDTHGNVRSSKRAKELAKELLCLQLCPSAAPAISSSTVLLV